MYVRRWSGLALFGAAALAACNGLTGVGDLAVEPAGTVAIDGAAPETSVVAVPDAAVDAPAPVVEAGPSCGDGRFCIAAPPSGWTGPFAVYEGDRSSAPACPGDVPTSTDENTGDPDGSFDCGSCSCGSPKDVACSATLVTYNDTACTVSGGDLSLSSCETPGGGGDVSYTAETTVSGGSCSPATGSPNRGSVTWANVVRSCAPATAFTGDGCAAGELCVPGEPSPFRACIRNDDETLACPAPWTDRLTTYTSTNDTRSCSAATCSCGAPTNVSCSGTLQQYTATTNCTGSFVSMAIPFTKCYETGGTTSQILAPGSLVLKGGSCAASGTPSINGTLTPGGDEAIFCCMP